MNKLFNNFCEFSFDRSYAGNINERLNVNTLFRTNIISYLQLFTNLWTARSFYTCNRTVWRGDVESIFIHHHLMINTMALSIILRKNTPESPPWAMMTSLRPFAGLFQSRRFAATKTTIVMNVCGWCYHAFKTTQCRIDCRILRNFAQVRSKTSTTIRYMARPIIWNECLLPVRGHVAAKWIDNCRLDEEAFIRMEVDHHHLLPRGYWGKIWEADVRNAPCCRWWTKSSKNRRIG